jgi:hypothetical protein
LLFEKLSTTILNFYSLAPEILFCEQARPPAKQMQHTSEKSIVLWRRGKNIKAVKQQHKII